MENNKSFVKIVCPHCGREYTLGEIFIGKYLTGKSSTVVNDPKGKILYVDWDEEPDLTEKFTCESCNKEFNVNLTITANTSKKAEEVDFSTETASLF